LGVLFLNRLNLLIIICNSLTITIFAYKFKTNTKLTTMRNLKTLLAIMLAVVVASCVSTKLPDSYQVDPNPLVNKGGKVAVKVTGTIPAKSFHKKAIVEFTPYVKYNGGTQELKKLVLKGEKAEGEGTVVSTAEGATLTYTDNFDYKPEMLVSELWVKIKIKKGSKEQNLDDVKLADGIIITSTRVGNGEDVQLAAHGYEKVTYATQSANIYFAYNKSNLSWSLKLNKEHSDDYDAMKDFVAKGWKIKDIAIDAWASPEGELTLNQELSDDRGATAKKQVISDVKKMIRARDSKLTIEDAEEDVQYNVVAKGADFDGFMKALDGSGIKEKDKIANVIKSQNTKSQREQQIRNMTVIYQEVEDMLAVLRRAEITVTCFEPKFTDEEIAKFALSNPDTLDVNELLYAATLTQDANTQMKIYQTVVTKYPKCWRAHNNLAAVYIQMGNIERASSLLAKAAELKPGNGLVANNMGVIAAYKKDYQAAEKYYSEAQEQGVNVAYNMGVIKMIKGDFAGAEQAFSSKNCDYNLALAQLENGNAAAATKTLDCADKTGEVYYLYAVIGARTNNTTMLIENLSKAINAVPAYKEVAKKDLEFIKFKDKAEFQNLVK
jgi:tetratricopeptide (TPR) repeat protein